MYLVLYNQYFKPVGSHAAFKPFACWFVWMMLGCLFYGYDMDLPFGKAFYMSVNVGYSIGWGFPYEDTTEARYFSCFYVMLGASAVAAALGFFAQSMIESSKEWYADALDTERHDTATGMDRVWAWAKLNAGTLKVVCIWLVWILILLIWSMIEIDWDLSEGLLFAISSLSTGGLWGPPTNSPDWYYGFIAFMAATGVPLMAMAMGGIASMVISVGDPDQAQKTLGAKVTHEELKMMQKFDLDDGDGEISRAEFILLCAVRLGALSPELIGNINTRFKELDDDNSGALSYSEILQEPDGERTQDLLKQREKRKSIYASEGGTDAGDVQLNVVGDKQNKDGKKSPRNSDAAAAAGKGKSPYHNVPVDGGNEEEDEGTAV